MLQLRISSSRATFQEKTNPLNCVAKDTANIPLASGFLLFANLSSMEDFYTKTRAEMNAFQPAIQSARDFHPTCSQTASPSFWVVKFNIKEKGRSADGILSMGLTLLLCLRPSVSDTMKVQTFKMPNSLWLSSAGIRNCLNSCACASDHNMQCGGCFMHLITQAQWG